jgi:glycine/D-amino acid oxidase-like deaminating enzyme
MHLKLNRTPFATTSATVDQAGRYQPVSYWHETVHIVPGEPLREKIDCDVAIVGGGFTALSTACELKQADPSLQVVLLEQAVIGHGASGRNGGFAMPLIGWDLSDAVSKLGESGAQQAYRLMYQAVAHLKQLVARWQIDCDLEATGYLLLSNSPARDAHIQREAELGQRLGFDHRLLTREETREHIVSESFRIGVYDPQPVILNPAKLVRRLKDVAERLGVRIFEQTPLIELVDGEPLQLTTPAGEVWARCAVLAVNGYSAALGFMPSRIVPVHTFIILTEPLTDAQLESIGWHLRRTSLETTRNFIHYFRLTVDNRIAFGGEDATLYFRGGYRDSDPQVFSRLEARFREYFPSLRTVRFTHRWGGVLGVTLDMFPTMGVGGQRRSIFHAAGYSGHGVALSNYAGKILTPSVLQHLRGDYRKLAECPFFWNRQPTWLPGEPLRYAGLQVYRAALRLHDWWLERPAQ